MKRAKHKGGEDRDEKRRRILLVITCFPFHVFLSNSLRNVGVDGFLRASNQSSKPWSWKPGSVERGGCTSIDCMLEITGDILCSVYWMPRNSNDLIRLRSFSRLGGNPCNWGGFFWLHTASIFYIFRYIERLSLKSSMNRGSEVFCCTSQKLLGNLDPNYLSSEDMGGKRCQGNIFYRVFIEVSMQINFHPRIQEGSEYRGSDDK
jgi:hypothetical protein